jgi:hypothetical protein
LSHTPQPDFLQPLRKPHRLAWVSLGVAVGVLGLAAFDALQAWQARGQVQVLAAPRATVRPTAAPAETARLRATRQALDGLNRPWPDAFNAIETVRVPGLTWLVLDIGERGQLRLEGLAPDAESAIAAAEVLRHRHPFGDVLLERMDKAGDVGLRFVLLGQPAAGQW